ncbi:MAG: rRNA maturation RNase YbeY [Victivallaceae bacterium]
MKILVSDCQNAVSVCPKSVKSVVSAVLRFLDVFTDELSIRFVSEEEMCDLHLRFFNDPSSTDTISLPMDFPTSEKTDFHVLGEVFINPQAAIDFLNSRKTRKKFDLYKEITLYLVHSVLHLCGYDDVNHNDRKTMRLKESEILNLLQNDDILITSKT